ncbi:hypothetical protein ILYODFUR_011363 [Ilyodon furcidens]|uniref:Uncharacterized protein n=1 Tax=Ilyodon furcidens TaxID=33524 RepID=A0ABV0SLJ4_9TELE
MRPGIEVCSGALVIYGGAAKARQMRLVCPCTPHEQEQGEEVLSLKLLLTRNRIKQRHIHTPHRNSSRLGLLLEPLRNGNKLLEPHRNRSRVQFFLEPRRNRNRLRLHLEPRQNRGLGQEWWQMTHDVRTPWNQRG